MGPLLPAYRAPAAAGTYRLSDVRSVGLWEKRLTCIDRQRRKAIVAVVLAAPPAKHLLNGKDWKDFSREKEAIKLKGLAGTVAISAGY